MDVYDYYFYNTDFVTSPESGLIRKILENIKNANEYIMNHFQYISPFVFIFEIGETIKIDLYQCMPEGPIDDDYLKTEIGNICGFVGDDTKKRADLIIMTSIGNHEEWGQIINIQIIDRDGDACISAFKTKQVNGKVKLYSIGDNDIIATSQWENVVQDPPFKEFYVRNVWLNYKVQNILNKILT